MGEFIAVVVITILVVISPGADFAVVTKNSYLYGGKIGVITSLGISIGVLIHVAYTLVVVSFVVTYTPHILNIVKYIGAIYLIYIGYKIFTQLPITDKSDILAMGPSRAIKYGFFTNALNPKTTFFVISTYTQILSISTPKIILVGYGLFMSFSHFIWFSFVSLLFSSIILRHKMLFHQVKINKTIGFILCSFGVALLFAKLN